MPSGYEHCGLNGTYGVHSETVPVVRITDGLADSMAPHIAVAGSVFAPYSGDGMVDAIEAALEHRRQPDRWRTLQRACMRQDFFRDVSATARYVQENRDAIERR